MTWFTLVDSRAAQKVHVKVGARSGSMAMPRHHVIEIAGFYAIYVRLGFLKRLLEAFLFDLANELSVLP